MSEEIQRSIGRIEGKMDAFIEAQKDHHRRLSSVEKKVWYASGAYAIIASVVTYIFGRH